MFIFFLIIFSFLFLISCTSTPVKDQGSDTISSNNKDTKTTSSEKGTSRSTNDTRSTKSEEAKKRKTTSYKDDSGSVFPSLFNFITHRGKDSLTEGEDYFIYILIYGSLFAFIYVAIILKIIHRRQRK